MADEIGLIYDLVGLALFSPGGRTLWLAIFPKDHFAIFDYDGMQHNGSPVLNKTAKIGQTITRNLPRDSMFTRPSTIRGGSKLRTFFQFQCQL